MGDSGGQMGKSGQSSKNPPMDTSDALDVAIELLEDIQKMVGVGRPKSLKIRFGDKTIARIPP